jgi:hypothetical protein
VALELGWDVIKDVVTCAAAVQKLRGHAAVLIPRSRARGSQPDATS